MIPKCHLRVYDFSVLVFLNTVPSNRLTDDMYMTDRSRYRYLDLPHFNFLKCINPKYKYIKNVLMN